MIRFFTLSILFQIGFITYCYGQDKKVSILFAGDAMQHKSQLVAAKTSDGYDYSSYFQLIKKQIENVDIAVVNLETTLPGKNYTGYPTFGSPDTFAYSLKDAGFNIFLTANNHSLDKGKKGVERTIEVLDSMHVKHLGTYVDEEKKGLYYPMMVVRNGIRIAFLNYTYGTNGIDIKAPNVINLIDKEEIMKDLESTKFMNPDIIIANMHWGDEYVLKPNVHQKKLADFLINNGVDLVIGSHPHVVQPIDIRRDNDKINNIVVYSLGNFVSGMSKINTDGGMMVKIDISKNDNNVINIDSCNYSLVWVHKPIENGKTNIQLIPVEEYENEGGKKILGEKAYNKMATFSKNAKKAIESLWPKTDETTNVADTTAQ